MSFGFNKAFISLFLVTVLWGFNFPISAYLLGHFSPVFLSTVRICFTSLFLIGVAFIHKGMKFPTSTEWKYLAGVGIFGTLLNQTFYFTGLNHTTPGNASLIIAMSPIATIILERIVFKEKLTGKKAAGAVISLAGVFSIIGISQGSLGISWGDFNIVLAMVSLSVSLLFVRGLTKTMNSFAVTIFSTVLGSALMIPAAGVEGLISGWEISHSPLLWVLLISAGVIAQGLAGFWWNNGIASVGAGTAAMFMNIPPFIAILASHFVLGDEILLSQIIGGVLVLLGVFIANMPSVKPVIEIKSTKSI
ncbi:DMT family transporter [Bacillus sp. V5-8f]|uniref:DMT family transporter n=1 Tax=Bacillus sp. V5-8f TaxID=2053044 RepID=UPI000C75F8C4|nr:DMT family transporter [Bacillus sp. V5-8f]PLT35133.1 hypothetical protein CUU64_07065 [Bacillus sp. V5-8f]